MGNSRVKKYFLTLAGFALIGGLTGCGGSSSNSPVTQYGVFYDAYNSIDNNNVPANFTPENNMPNSGAVTYSGVGFVFYGVGASETQLLGETNIRANFGNDSLSGTMTNFVGGTGIGTSAEQISGFDGTLSVTGEVGTVAAGCNACLIGNLSGTLQGAGDTVQINSGILGDFYGTAYNSIGGFTPNNTQLNVDGVLTPGGANFVAER